MQQVMTMSAEQQLEEAQRAEAAQDYVLALERYREALALEPGNLQATLGLGEMALAFGDADHALELFTSALMRHGAIAAAYRGRGLAFFNLGLIDKAVGDLKRAIEIDPQDPEIHMSLGLVVSELGQYEVAKLALERANELSPNDGEVVLELARVYLILEEAQAAQALLDTQWSLSSELAEHLSLLRLVLDCQRDGDWDPLKAFLKSNQDEEIASFVAPFTTKVRR